MADLVVGRHRFAFRVLTGRNVSAPARFETETTADGLVARAVDLEFGDGTQRSGGSLEARVVHGPGGSLRWQVRATAAEPIKGIKVEVDALPNGTIRSPSGRVVELNDGQVYAAAFPAGAYPSRVRPTSGVPAGSLPWAPAQFLVLDTPGDTLVLRSEDFPPRAQRYWCFRQGESLTLAVYSEANAAERQREYATPMWSLDRVPDWAEAVAAHVDWMARVYGVTGLARRSDAPRWLGELCLNVTFHGDANDGKLCHSFAEMERRLGEIARFCDPRRTHVHVVGWDGRWDYTWPAFDPDPLLGGRDGFRRFVDTAHGLGYRVGPHLNVWGLGYDHPEFPKLQHFLEHQVRDSQDRPLGWAYDWDGDEVDEEIFAYISPDHEPWRRYLRGRILSFVAEYDIDVVHLDQASTYVNDRRHNHWRGVRALYQELRRELPARVALSGEATSEVVAACYPFGGTSCMDDPEMHRRLFGPFVRQFDYGYPPEDRRGIYPSPWRWTAPAWSEQGFYDNLRRSEEAGLLPTLLLHDRDVRVDSKEAHAVYAAAARFRERFPGPGG